MNRLTSARRHHLRRAATAMAIILTAAGLAVPATPSPAAAATTAFTALADARVEAAEPARNFGSSGRLTTDGSPLIESYLSFQVTKLSGPVTRARLRLAATSTTKDGPAAFATATGWSESSITWNNRPGPAGTALADLGGIARTGTYDLDVTGAVTGNGAYAFVLRSVSTDGVDFKSSEHSSGRPQLIVETGAATTTTTLPPTTTTTTTLPPTTTTTAPPTTTTTRPPTTTTTAAPTTTTTTLPPSTDPPAHDGPTFPSVADGTVHMDTPDTPDGHSQTLVADESPETQSYLRFNVSGVTLPVERAQVQLFVADKSGDGPSVFLTGTGWTEDTLTWDSRPPAAGPALDSLGGIAAGTWVTLDVTSEVRGTGQVNFVLVGDGSDGADFRSREAATGRPRLILTLGDEEPPPPSTTTTTRPPTDTTAPQTTIDSAAGGPLTMTATFHASETPATFECRVNSLDWWPCTSPMTLPGLTVGSHTLAVRATDAAGNTDSTPATRSFTVQTGGSPSDPRDVFLAPSVGALWGVHYQLPSSGATTEERKDIIRDLEARLGRTLAIDHYYEPWGDTFPTWREPFDFDEGRIPMISWSKPHDGTVLQILNGSQDDYIKARARGVRGLGEPVFVRWFWEMEGSRNENVVISPQLYVAAWRHIHDLWEAEGVRNVAWVWCPNASSFKNNKAQLFYPGDDYVDWVCGDGYNWWPDQGQDYDEFGDKFEAVNDWAASRGKPAMAGEWGAQQMEPGRRAEWFRQALIDTKSRLHNLLALVYFSSVGTHDWTLESEPDAFAAFREMGLDPWFNPCGVGIPCPEAVVEPTLEVDPLFLP